MRTILNVLKATILTALAALCASAMSAPLLVSDPYPSTGVQPDSATFTINGGPAQPCAIVAVAGGLQPQCDLASITAPGVYTLVMTVSRAPSLTNIGGGAVKDSGGSASSAPFRYELVVGGVGTPVLRVLP